MKSAIMLFAAGMLLLIGAVLALSQDAAVDHGKEVFGMQKCAMCHSISGVGGSRMALDGVGTRLKPEDIRKWIRTPKEMKADTTMKAYPNLPEKDLRDLVVYLTTLK
jgi:cytochrome c2